MVPFDIRNTTSVPKGHCPSFSGSPDPKFLVLPMIVVFAAMTEERGDRYCTRGIAILGLAIFLTVDEV